MLVREALRRPALAKRVPTKRAALGGMLTRREVLCPEEGRERQQSGVKKVKCWDAAAPGVNKKTKNAVDVG